MQSQATPQAGGLEPQQLGTNPTPLRRSSLIYATGLAAPSPGHGTPRTRCLVNISRAALEARCPVPRRPEGCPAQKGALSTLSVPECDTGTTETGGRAHAGSSRTRRSPRPEGRARPRGGPARVHSGGATRERAWKAVFCGNPGCNFISSADVAPRHFSQPRGREATDLLRPPRLPRRISGVPSGHPGAEGVG